VLAAYATIDVKSTTTHRGRRVAHLAIALTFCQVQFLLRTTLGVAFSDGTARRGGPGRALLFFEVAPDARLGRRFRGWSRKEVK